MTNDRSARAAIVFAAIMRVAAFAAIWIPVAAILGVQTSTARIMQFSEYTGAMIHTMITSTFAVILATSMLINAIIAARRIPDRPAALLKPTRYPLAQLALMVTAIGWTVAVLTDYRGESPVIPVLAVLTVALSIVVFVFAVRADPASRAASATRIEAQREDPSHARRRRRVRVVAAILVGVAAITTTLVALIPQTRTGCTFDGGGQFNDQWSLFSPNCGVIATSVTDPTIEQLVGGHYTVITQGYRWAIWPEPILIELRAE